MNKDVSNILAREKKAVICFGCMRPAQPCVQMGVTTQFVIRCGGRCVRVGMYGGGMAIRMGKGDDHNR